MPITVVLVMGLIDTIMELSVGDSFSSFSELENKVKTYQTENSVEIWKTDTKIIATAKRRMPNCNFNSDIEYTEIWYSYLGLHGGRKHSSISYVDRLLQ